jgi:hypothetical protein
MVLCATGVIILTFTSCKTVKQEDEAAGSNLAAVSVGFKKKDLPVSKKDGVSLTSVKVAVKKHEKEHGCDNVAYEPKSETGPVTEGGKLSSIVIDNRCVYEVLVLVGEVKEGRFLPYYQNVNAKHPENSKFNAKGVKAGTSAPFRTTLYLTKAGESAGFSGSISTTETETDPPSTSVDSDILASFAGSRKLQLNRSKVTAETLDGKEHFCFEYKVIDAAAKAAALHLTEDTSRTEKVDCTGLALTAKIADRDGTFAAKEVRTEGSKICVLFNPAIPKDAAKSPTYDLADRDAVCRLTTGQGENVQTQVIPVELSAEAAPDKEIPKASGDDTDNPPAGVVGI